MTNQQRVVISLSVGSIFLTVSLVLIVSFCLLACGSIHHDSLTRPHDTIAPARLPSATAIEAELKYGPVNDRARTEVKQGLFQRIAEARRQRLCNVQHQHSQPCQPQATQVQIVCPPRPDVPSYFQPAYVSSVPVYAPAIQPGTGSPPTTSEYPQTNTNCVPCRDIDQLFKGDQINQRTAVKTGSFVCSNCRKPCVGHEWHTDWTDDGTPITFLCKRCNSLLSAETKMSVYQRYSARQFALQGKHGLNHPESE